MKSFLFLLIISFNVQAALDDIVLTMVPRGKVVDSMGREFTIKTPAGTKIDIEFRRNGKLKEATGRNLNAGDDIEPGEGLISLSSAAQKLQLKGIRPKGHWLLEEDSDLGWIYEIENNLISAKSGKILKTSTVADSRPGLPSVQ